MSRTGPTSSSRALEAILPLISAGQPYEAHQKARTFATRYTKSGAHAIAIDVLFQSARELLKAGHTGSGTDLAMLLLDSYDGAREPVSDVSRGMFVASYSIHAEGHRLTLFRSSDSAHRSGGSLRCVAQEHR
jgi:golgi to ER traffic protein 4